MRKGGGLNVGKGMIVVTEEMGKDGILRLVKGRGVCSRWVMD